MEAEEGEGPTYLLFGGRWGTAVRCVHDLLGCGTEYVFEAEDGNWRRARGLSEARKEGEARGDEGRGGGDPSGDA